MTDEFISTPDYNPSQLHGLADKGTREAILEIQKFLDSVTVDDSKAIAEIALGEAKFHYFSPENDKEKRDYELCFLIDKRICKHMDRSMKLEKLKYDLSYFILNLEVQQKMFKNKKVSKFSVDALKDLCTLQKSRVDEITNAIEEDEVWIETAKSMIKLPKYKDPEIDFLKEIALGDYMNTFDYEEEDCEGGCA